MEGTKLTSYWCLLQRNSSLLGVLSVDMCSSKYIGVTVLTSVNPAIESFLLVQFKDMESNAGVIMS
jgi:hypothetical protein